MCFGDRMQEIRIDKKMLQKELADKLGVSVATISHYENNTHSPDVKSLAQISLALNVSSDYLIGISDNPYPNQENECVIKVRSVLPEKARKELTEYIEFLYFKYKIYKYS